jgi:histidine triad (HIT) family protein
MSDHFIMNSCLFCRIIKKEIPSRIIYEDAHIVAFEDVHPQAPVHILVVPRKHIGSLSEVKAEDTGLMDELFTVARQMAKDRQIASRGYRTVINCGREGGQTVYHLHLHLLGGRQMTWPPG